ncbi:hypothetical protein GUJ93_ZPchr0007g5543 [Zizania palustris]|uniref:thioredoxin-dependent peroxiredoxin n=1 Tax=Zizania palustris TaxID=103762 RepID=A0A8J5TJC1_ZIZPA|nr:hypothetical protein GUJ93_ZPchr0007g5543 [Zizania palustris]
MRGSNVPCRWMEEAITKVRARWQQEAAACHATSYVSPMHYARLTTSSPFVVTMPGLTIGDTVPNLELDSTHGKIRIHDFVGHGYAIIFSHPGDFTPVCTTELSAMAGYAKEFEKRGVKLLGISCDDVKSHKEWIKDIEAYKPGNRVTYPIMADPDREAIKQLNMVDPDEKDSNGGELPSRALHIVGPDKKVKLSFLYPACAGRNIDEVVRAVDALQMAANHAVATPANWKPGERVVIPPGVSDEEARRKFPKGFDTADLPSRKGYLRFTEYSTHGKIRIHDFVGDDYAVIFSHPADFTPVCTTELSAMAGYAGEFAKRGVKLLGFSCDDVESHKEWIKDIEAYKPGNRVGFPIVADPDREAIRQLNMVDPVAKDSDGAELPSRALHIVGRTRR